MHDSVTLGIGLVIPGSTIVTLAVLAVLADVFLRIYMYPGGPQDVHKRLQLFQKEHQQ